MIEQEVWDRVTAMEGARKKAAGLRRTSSNRLFSGLIRA